MNKKGNIVIETAITFSIVIVLLTVMVNCIIMYQTDINMQRALVKTCDDFSLLTPLSVTATDAISTYVNASPILTEEDNREMLERVSSTISGFDLYIDHNLSAGALDLLLSQTFENDIYGEYIEFCNNDNYIVPNYLDVDFEIDSSRAIILVIMTYDFDLFIGNHSKTITYGIPFWGDMELFVFGDNEDIDNNVINDVWSRPNFVRGQMIIREFGGNMPQNFPVINRWDGSNAVSICSINTFSSGYLNTVNLERTILQEITELSEFTGGSSVYNGFTYSISEEEICTKTLIIVIPANSDMNSINIIEGLRNQANMANVDLVIEQYGYV